LSTDLAISEKPPVKVRRLFAVGVLESFVMMKLLQLLLIMLSLTPAACGFAPRGGLIASAPVGAIFVDASRDVELAELLRDNIVDQGLSLAPGRDQANVLVRLTNERQAQRVVSVQSAGRVSEFELRHAIDLLIIRASAGEIARYGTEGSPDRVTVRREYTFDDTGVLGKEDEASILQRELRQELARQLLLRIIAGA